MQQRSYSHSLDDIKLSDWDFWLKPLEERDAAFAFLRKEHPVAFFEEGETSFHMPGPGYWAVTRHADVLQASLNPHIFSSAQGIVTTDTPPDTRDVFGSMIVMDDPRHKRLRSLVSQAFTPRHLRKVDEDVKATAQRVVNNVIETGSCDFVTDIAAPFPIQIICDMMGIPPSQYDFVFERTNILLGGADPEYGPADLMERYMAAIQAARDLFQLMDEMRQERLRQPSDDLTSALVHAELDGDRLTVEELGSFFVLLTAAGNETTRNAIAHGVRLLDEHPDQRRLWQSDFEAYYKTAIEEIVRYASPVIYMRRTTLCDTELGGQRLREGEKVILYYTSANRDEAAFDHPDTFDISRTKNDHVGFGAGPHFCLGANLARREMEVMFRELFQRMPDIRMTGEPERLKHNFIHGIKHMPCAFTPGPVVD
jgi:cytochrome P450